MRLLPPHRLPRGRARVDVNGHHSWEISGYRCKISEYNDGKVYRAQDFDVSLIERVDRIKDHEIAR
jgi:hypothetical protein